MKYPLSLPPYLYLRRYSHALINCSKRIVQKNTKPKIATAEALKITTVSINQRSSCSFDRIYSSTALPKIATAEALKIPPFP